ncbi:fungal-specific transcription factor domain-containing protein [Hypoxylon trugodes]|uniref:fungal-specific transcription factor domain-containing protein n=1 Tax=Hypoxylon trugodes TaxID=326681 RepID=UPI00218EDAD2|nr:fungal-specific transcription factor domain-containing protein [Hypoxylon trugodes]KAI1383322.1 fungal-specific transcription factor domain-containing protein [Hypoxylon trugodes]
MGPPMLPLGFSCVRMDDQLEFSPNPCWTCRRRRLKCDGCLPTCFKCKTKGRECLGYGTNKPLVWAGLESRGKMVRQCFGEQTIESLARKQRLASLNLLLNKTLTDPAFQDLSPRARHHISYYIDRCCLECTLYEPEAPNAFKQFLTLMPGNPVLIHSILAVAASHQARAVAQSAASPSENGISRQLALNCTEVTRFKPPNDASSAHYSDALTHSSISLGALREALAKTAETLDALIAAVILLIWVDVVDSGKSAWKHHLEGLKVLLSSQRAESRPNATSTLQTWFEETFSILSTIGSTFDPRLLPLLNIFSQSELDQILGGTELHSWIGCPADLLSTLHTFNATAITSEPPSSQDVTRWFTRIQDFDTEKWAAECPLPESAQSRRSLGEAWKGAIEIYGRRALSGRCADFQEVSDQLVQSTLSHLSQIDPNDTHFKGTVWPMFVVGGEARTDEQRQAILTAFGHLLEFSHLSMFYLALGQLKRAWSHSTPYPPGSSWIHEIWEHGEGLLLI